MNLPHRQQFNGYPLLPVQTKLCLSAMWEAKGIDAQSRPRCQEVPESSTEERWPKPNGEGKNIKSFSGIVSFFHRRVLWNLSGLLSTVGWLLFSQCDEYLADWVHMVWGKRLRFPGASPPQLLTPPVREPFTVPSQKKSHECVKPLQEQGCDLLWLKC